VFRVTLWVVDASTAVARRYVLTETVAHAMQAYYFSLAFFSKEHHFVHNVVAFDHFCTKNNWVSYYDLTNCDEIIQHIPVLT